MIARRRSATLRTRLVALLLVLLTAGFAVIAIVTTLAIRTFLLDRLDAQLRAAGDRYSVSLEHPDDHDADNTSASEALGSVTGQASGTLGARVVDGRVTAAAVVGRDPDDPATAPGSQVRAALARLHVAAKPQDVRLAGLGDYRVLVTRGRDSDVLVTGLPIRSVHETTEHLLAVEAVVFGATFVLVAVGGGLAVRLALRPLTRMAETASGVADLPLADGTVSLPHRADDADPRTEIGRLGGAFNTMLNHVESSLQRRQDSEDRLRRFVADASHELRTPVAVVRSHAELARRLGGELPPDVAHSLARITAESERMGHLVEDLLLLARLDTGRPLARDEVDLTRVVLDAVSDARVAGPGHHWRMDLPEEPVTVAGDEHALHQLLANLLANARSHTPAGTTVRVTLAGDPLGPAELTVGDDGPGIPPAIATTLFERFVRGDDVRDSRTGGGGLGLAIVDGIVHVHGGSIAVASTPGDTRFTVTLPRWDGAEAHPTAVPNSDPIA